MASAPESGQAREDAIPKVTGAARYTSDLTIPGCLHAAIARSEIAHGELRAVDVREAQSVPGVVATLVGEELSHLDAVFGEWVLDQPPLATGRIRFHGEPIAAVVADSPRAAHLGALAVTADVVPIDASLDMAAALRDDALPVHPPGDAGPNVCSRSDLEVGDVTAGLRAAAWVHEATYEFPAVFHYAMEPYTCLADWDGDLLDVQSATQEPFKVREQLARIFDLPLNRVRMRVAFIGGGFGGKAAPKYEPLVAALAMKVARPVKLVTDVRGSFLTVSRHAARITVITGMDAENCMIARDTHIDYDTGAYADKGPRVARKGAYRAAGPYRIANVRATARAIYTNKLPAGAFRGFSTPQVVWAAESAIDEIATHLGEDPLAFRLRHLKERGEPFLGDDTPLDADLAEGIGRAATDIGWAAAVGPDSGRGLAVGVKDGGGGVGRSEAVARLHLDGSVDIETSTVELGQGSRTVLRAIAAVELGIPPERVRVHHVDTSSTPYDVGTGASRSTVAVGSAVADACRQLRRRVLDLTAEHAPGTVELVLDGTDVVASMDVDGNRATQRFCLAEVVATHHGLSAAEVGPLMASGVHTVSGGSGLLGSATPFYEVSHGAAEVDVDRDTGEIAVTRYVSVADVGHAMNRITCEGQDEGAVVMGLGHTLSEELAFDGEGQLLNGALIEYRVPRAGDLPEGGVRTVLLENGDGPGPQGAKGAGEGGIIPVAPAIANAVAAATGVRLRVLPLTPERVWRTLRDADPRPAPSRGGSGDRGPPASVEDQTAAVEESGFRFEQQVDGPSDVGG